MPDIVTKYLSKQKWQAKQRKHRQVIAEIIDPYLKERQHHHKDPVLDFLFEYYAFRPSYLKRWSPGTGILLRQADPQNAPNIAEQTITGKGAFLNPAHFPENRKRSARWILSVLENSLSNAPSFGCFGMHEWAMVYQTDNVRHDQFPLRMPKEELAQFVESRQLLCTHFDAFRFFTKPSKPMNKFDLSREKFADMEQPGCLHTNMDLYKWSFKLFPWICSDTIRKAFRLAVDTRTIDMKASPYDLRERDLEPIRIETRDGRTKYMKYQKDIYQRSIPIRRQLIKEYRRLIEYF